MSELTSVEKALMIINCFTDSPVEMSLADIAEKLKMPKSSMHRLCSSLVKYGFLSKDESSHRYRIGLKMLEVASVYLKDNNVASSVEQIMQDLCFLIGETVSIYILSGVERKCLMRIETKDSLRHTVEVGQALPLYAGASGKVILSESDSEFIKKYFDETDLSDRYDCLEAFQDELSSIKRAGFCITYGDRESFLSSVAVPLYGVSGEIFGALNVSGPLERCREKINDDIVKEVQAYGEKINKLVPYL